MKSKIISAITIAILAGGVSVSKAAVLQSNSSIRVEEDVSAGNPLAPDSSVSGLSRDRKGGSGDRRRRDHPNGSDSNDSTLSGDRPGDETADVMKSSSKKSSSKKSSSKKSTSKAS